MEDEDGHARLLISQALERAEAKPLPEGEFLMQVSADERRFLGACNGFKNLTVSLSAHSSSGRPKNPVERWRGPVERWRGPTER